MADKEAIPSVGKSDKSLEQQIQDLVAQEQKLVKETETKKEAASTETFSQIAKFLPRLIQRTLAKLEASTVYQTFKLPGRDYVVQDRRLSARETPAKEKEASIAEESKTSLQELLIQKGKLVKTKEKGYENYLGEAAGRRGIPESKAAQERLMQFLTRFEQALLKRFEQGAKLGQEVPNGQWKFFKKTVQQWHDFFARLVKRTVWRRVAAEQVQEWIFRGLVERQAKATVISDWALANGQLEKFVRYKLSPEAQNFLAMLAQAQPGQKLPKEQLRRFLSGELEYLAIKSGEEEQLFSQAPTKGKFLTTAQAEEKVAGDLGLQLGAQLQEKEKLLKRGKKGHGSLVPSPWSEESAEPETQFVPWWQFGPFKKLRGPFRWFVAVFYLILISLMVVGVLSLI